MWTTGVQGFDTLPYHLWHLKIIQQWIWFRQFLHHFCIGFLHVPYVWDMFPICFPSIHFGEKRNMCSIMFNPYIFAILTELPNYVLNKCVFFHVLSIFFLEKVVLVPSVPGPRHAGGQLSIPGSAPGIALLWSQLAAGTATQPVAQQPQGMAMGDESWRNVRIWPTKKIYKLGKTIQQKKHPPIITIFIGGMVTIPSHGWFMALFYPHYTSKKLDFMGSWPARMVVIVDSRHVGFTDKE